jgi:sodium/potassium-transporting ATPase subunit alpha
MSDQSHEPLAELPPARNDSKMPLERRSPEGGQEPYFPPPRSNSKLARRRVRDDEIAQPGQEPVRRPSQLARMKIASLDILPSSAERQFEPSEMPQREPSKLVRRVQSALKEGKLGELVKDSGVAWHTMPLEQFFTQVHSRLEGLTEAEVEAARKKHGFNEIDKPPRESLLSKFLHNVFSPFSSMMLLASVLCFIITGVSTSQGNKGLDVQNLALALALLVVVLVAASFQTSMEYQADNLMEALSALTADKAWVIRDGKLQQIPARLLVPGDVVKVQYGEKVPGDLRVISANSLKVNNSSLTGETNDISLGLEAKRPQLFEALNIARAGCSFTSGNGTGVLFATGNNTFFGGIAKATLTAERPDSLMRREVRRLVLVMGVIGTCTGFAFFGAALGTKKGYINAIVTLVGLFVANIPEGLLPQITLALTITASRMKDERVIVSSLEIIETLGAVSTICSDKTGTLTLNQMTAVHVVYGNVLHTTPAHPEEGVAPCNHDDVPLRQIRRVIALCSEAAFISKDPAVHPRLWPTKGDASEVSLIVFHQNAEDIDDARANHKRLAVIPFSSVQKYMASVNRLEPGTDIVTLKGASEQVVQRCSRILNQDGSEEPMSSEVRDQLTAFITQLAKRGERVLGFAQAVLRNQPEDFAYDVDDPNFPLMNLTFLGLVALMDPPRPSVPGAIEACKRAGVHVIMITGDHPMTAVAIARSIGIITRPLISDHPSLDPQECSVVVTGDEISRYTQEDWDRALSCREHVFARTQPQQKQEIVWRLQERGQIVAMTGDGVNDAPALKAANVGVCVASGTNVAKEAAHLIIDDDFNSIVVGVKEGRQIFDNLKKALVFVISHLLPEILPFALNLALNIPLAIETIVILLIDLGTDLAPSICLAYEQAEPRVMNIPPRTANDHLVQPRMLIIAYLIAGSFEVFFAYWAFFWTFMERGFPAASLFGAGDGYREKFPDLSDTQQTFFQTLCKTTPQYTAARGGVSASCGTVEAMDEFMSYFSKTVSMAQSSYFVTFASMQFAYCLCYRHQVLSIFSRQQVVNYRLIISVLFSIGFMCFFVYVPGLNTAFYLANTPSSSLCSGLWGIPVVIGVEEFRKFWVRAYPNGRFAKATLY